MLDEPNGRFGRWGQAASALATFAILTFSIVFLVLDRLVGAPLWGLLLACVPIGVFSIAWGFTVVEDDEVDSATCADEDPRSDDLTIKLATPKGRFGRWGQVAEMVGAIFAVMFGVSLISTLVGEPFNAWNPWVRLSVLSFVVLIAFFMEMTTLGEDEEDSRTALPDAAPLRDSANARFHERDHKA
ncbi:MAG: hypothetical protein ACPGWS_01940 [Solirubrobacterales bacterium]